MSSSTNRNLVSAVKALTKDSSGGVTEDDLHDEEVDALEDLFDTSGSTEDFSDDPDFLEASVDTVRYDADPYHGVIERRTYDSKSTIYSFTSDPAPYGQGG